MEKEITIHDIERRLAALGKAVASLTAEKKPQAEPISFEHLGGKKVGHPMPVKTEKPIDFTSIGGKCVLKVGDHPLFNAKSESVETEDDARE